MFAEQGAAYADEQVGRLLAALNIDPHQLPAEGPGLGAASWDRIYGAAAPRLRLTRRTVAVAGRAAAV